MTSDDLAAQVGMPLPAGVIQPFDLRFVRDDLHVMAFFEGHPVYEAVEAMVRRVDGDRPIVRAILTRHDQSQIDHVNDPQLMQAASETGRETVLRDIAFKESGAADRRAATVEFLSMDGLVIVLHVVCASPPDAARGGLSDPGNHAMGSSLPVMWRGSSALAGPESRVSVAGVSHAIPVSFRAGPHFVAHKGYYTELHAMAILRAGQVSMEPTGTPQAAKVGEGWCCRTARGDLSRRISAVAGDGELTIEMTGEASEVIRGHWDGRRFRMKELRVGSGPQPASGVTLAFGEHDRFRIDIDGTTESVTGRWHCDDARGIRLIPEQPEWASARTVHVGVSRTPSGLTLTTTIGSSAESLE